MIYSQPFLGPYQIPPESKKLKKKAKKRAKVDPMTQVFLKMMGLEPQKKEPKISNEEILRQKMENREKMQEIIHENLQRQNEMLAKLTKKIANFNEDGPFAEKKKYIKEFEKRIRMHHEAKQRRKKEEEFQGKLSAELGRYLQQTSKYFMEAVGLNAPQSLFEKE